VQLAQNFGAPRLDGNEIHQVKRYELCRLLGEGGMGWVYQAYDPVLERTVALKIMKGDVPESEHRRFRREAIFGARFCHPSIVRVFDMGSMPNPDNDVGHTEWISMEYLPGVDMEEVLLTRAEKGESAPLRSVTEVFRQVLAGLQYAHDCKVVHRDVKPANIFVTRDPNTNFVTSKLLDFGVALDLDGPKREEAVCGDPRYMAPEQTYKNGSVDYTADVYSAGMSLYEILAGRHPFADLEGRDVRTWIEAQRVRPVGSVVEFLAPGTPAPISEALDYIIRRACDKEARLRYASALDMQRDMLALVDHCSAGVPGVLDDRAGMTP
jgi:serine/threonine-protein kinase